ncbi:MAG: SCO1664 family protein [Actinomycetota bacterium]
MADTSPDTPSADSAFDLPPEDLLAVLTDGEMEIEGRMPYSSNATFLVTMMSDDEESAQDGGPTHKAIYKPGKGERPLWDFPPDLYKREVAAYLLASELGWAVIPPTVVATGPFGEGSLQAFVDADFSEHYFTLHESGIGLDDLRRLCAFDVIANNTDRKSGHCLLGRDGRIYGIDHGLAFHAQYKLRTVMWDFVGEPLGDDVSGAVAAFVDAGPSTELQCLLDTFETDAMVSRASALLDAGEFPDDETGGHRYPWPLV